MEIILFLAGAFLGVGLSILVSHTNKANGTLRIDHSDPVKDVYRFEIDNLEKITNRKASRIVLKIDHGADLSHE